MQMGHRVEGVVADVEDQAVPRLGDALLARHLLGGADELGEQGPVLGRIEAADSTCRRGTTSTCVGAPGLMSRKA